MPHIINKQVIDLTLDKRVDSFHIQELISRQYWKIIVPGLERVFDKMGTGDEIIEVDKLVINLGVITENSVIQNDWIKDLPAKLEKILESLRIPSFSGITVIRRSKPLSVFRQWLYYMENGYLHWSTLKVDEQWYQDVLEALATDYESVQELRNMIGYDMTVVKRIAIQHPEGFLLNLIETLTAQKQDELMVIFKEVKAVFESDSGYAETRDKNQEKEFIKIFRIQILRAAAAGLELTPQMAGSNIKDAWLSRNLPSALLIKLAVRLPFIKEVFEDLETIRPIETDTFKISSVPSSVTVIDEEGIFVSNAGAVLLHPFLNQLFKRLKLVSEGNFTDTAGHQEALFLIHYLCTGNTTVAEHELVIAKVLCAYPLQESVDLEVVLSKTAMDAADELLIAAVQQWEILKNTTPSGLQEGFLQRNGKLFTRQDNLYLQVETSSIDVLLDQLPWNLGIIKLPWMEGILRVDWR